MASDGFRYFEALVDRHYGAEPTLQKINLALETVERGNQEAVTDTVQQIQAARREVQRMLRLPAERIAELTGPTAAKRPFAAWRRS